MSLFVKGHQGELELCFKENTTLDEAIIKFEQFIEENKKFFSGTDATFSYSGADLSYDEEIAFYKFLRKRFSGKIAFRKKQCLTNEQIEYSLGENESISLVVKHSLRSGEEVSSRGDVTLYGDVNPGAKIKARGNITIIGALRGEAHIEGKGRVFALRMQPSQIRIGKIISYNKNGENVGSAVASVKKGEIILDCL